MTMKKTIGLVTVGGLLLAAAAGYLMGQPAPDKEVAPSVDGAKAGAAAIREAGQSLVKAFAAGDAKGMAAHWTENGEYLADDGTTLRGRGEIEKSYAKLFEKRKGPVQAEIEMTEVRFPSKDSAIEEGYFKVRAGKEPPTTSKYTVLHVREGGRWLMALVREWPAEGVTIRDLEWLIGTWQAKRDDTVVRTVYSWWGDKTFLRADVSITQKGRTVQGFQMIGKDAASGEIRSWAFDVGGSFSQATWSRDGKKCVQDSTSVLDNGSTVTATNIVTPIDENSFTFQSVERAMNGEEIDDIPPIRVTRVPGKEVKP
jgi:uncharacterized protein (TIGR02246 family)